VDHGHFVSGLEAQDRPMTDQQRTYPDGVPSWVDLNTPDPGDSQAFYRGLFGWDFETATPPGVPPYEIATLGGLDVGGLAPTSDASVADAGPAFWATYVSVDDADATVERAVAAGGKVVSYPQGGGDGGRSAVLSDPAGAEIRLWEPKRRLGAQKVNEPGSWVFNHLRSPGPDALDFYRAVWGWEDIDMSGTTMIRRLGYGAHLAATVSPQIMEMIASVGAPAEFADVVAAWSPEVAAGDPYWHVSFSVADRDVAAARAVELGASVEDTAETEWSRDATIVDPQGARLTLSQFVPPT